VKLGSASFRRRLVALLAIIVASATLHSGRTAAANATAPAQGRIAVILLYHRFGPKVTDNMTVTTPVFAWQMKYLHENGYSVVPLSEVVKFVLGSGSLPPRAVAIAADDGHRTVFTDMKPLVEHYRIPVTLFIYPSAISNASYAMTWEQLRDLKATGLFSIESHTYWHPNFRSEKKRLAPEAYRGLVATQLNKSREILERRFNSKVEMLAWPFGIYDEELIAAARKAGYIAAFSIERRNVAPGANVMAIPRYIVTNHDTGRAFANLVSGGSAERSIQSSLPDNPY
jgi:peptidoglycan/xylan/chitin deacetylase (PgdA/CDA1 family)